MKKWIIVIIVAAAIGATWYYLRTWYRFTPAWYEPSLGTVTRGDINVPITAAGLIEPDKRIEVKSLASGEVTRVHVVEGTFVREGDTLIELKRDDEQRRRDSAAAELTRAQALRAQALAAVDRAKANILGLEAEIAQWEAQCEISDFELRKVLGFMEQRAEGLYSEQELVNARARHNSNLASHQRAKAQLAGAQATLREAEQNVLLQQAAVDIAETNLATAEERLDETTIRSKYDALVTNVRVKISEVIQSGTTSLTGGTVVMYLADVSQKKVITRVDESDYGRVLNISPVTALPEMPGLRQTVASGDEELARRSGRVTLTVDAFPEETFEGVIERVEPQGKLSQGSAIIQYDVHVAVTDENVRKLPLGAQAQVEFTIESAPNALRVPSEAVRNHQGQRGVWIVVDPEPGSRAKWGQKFVACRFGITDGEFTQVTAVLGDFQLKPGLRVYTKLPVDQDERER